MESQAETSLRKHATAEVSQKTQILKIFEAERTKIEHEVYQPKIVLGKIQDIVFQPFKDQQSTSKVCEIAQFWKVQGDYQLPHLYNNDDVVGAQLLQFYSSSILTARVLKKIKDFIERLVGRRLPKDQEEYQNLQDLRTYIYDNELSFVYGRQFLQKKLARFSHHSYNYNSAVPTSRESQGKNIIQQFYKKSLQCKIQFPCKLLQLLATLDIIKLEGIQPKIQNQFMRRLQNIKRQEQRTMFVQDYSFSKLQQLRKLVQPKQLHEFNSQLLKLMPNYMFYKNKNLIRGQMNLQKMHDKYQDYSFLEHTHDYIQWMFPNHYGSSFNSKSAPLTYIQSELFLQDQQIALSIFQSVVLFFDFMGIKFNHNLQLVIEQAGRLKDVILHCYHNHLRLMRILACLSVVGFREIAIKFIDFLDYHTKQGMLKKERSQFEKNWKIYGDDTLQKAKEMCFLQKQAFPPSQQFWKDIAIKIPFNNNKKCWTSTSYFYQPPKQSQNKQKNEKVDNEKKAEEPAQGQMIEQNLEIQQKMQQQPKLDNHEGTSDHQKLKKQEIVAMQQQIKPQTHKQEVGIVQDF